ncbi:NAD+ synthase [Iodidimonas nitroreducens]|uniref:Glutamine-dependent NAD(+) synthetase n=1 Tax=Iodidimonas nitroreducens TaxID=1236968 RepID=A0A5A7NCT6_9PROT|nr:NAD+ synthase [Iodidimonas nitroreducens]GAK32268.1 glutamine-dependent NAD(+) synthetase [alpha proteobacterium Q-1]GER04879.1 NAD+ synthase [Iodidimonas nitroreducens]
MTAVSFKIALVQGNPTVGDMAGNVDLIREARARAARMGADLVLTSELSLVGYPTEDLILKPFFQRMAMQAAEELAKDTADGGPALIVGAPWIDADGGLYNAALVMDGGSITDRVYKSCLPNYGVFDEKRLFTPARAVAPVMVRGHCLGVMICEDMWFADTARSLADQGAEILLVPTASPFESNKLPERLSVARERVFETGLPLVFANQMGGQDEIIFDGSSFVLNPRAGEDAEIMVQLAGFQTEEEQLVFEGSEGTMRAQKGVVKPAFSDLEAIWQAMVLGLRDYIAKNGFPGVLIGLSGGIDSALTAAIAVDALGPDRVRTVMMPSRFTSAESLDDAAACAKMLGVRLDEVSIVPGVLAFDQMMADLFAGRAVDNTEENIQSRLRGMILMALSNKFGDLVLTTGNKSEVSVGYATLYGDMCGGYSVLKDIYKTTVFALSRWRNAHYPLNSLGPDGAVMPDRVISKPPTAELRADQKDEDSLPPYDVLDDILLCLVEGSMPVSEIVARGHDPQTVARIEQLLYIAEYKRRQAAPGVKISRKSFGRDRRFPITNGFRSARIK